MLDAELPARLASGRPGSRRVSVDTESLTFGRRFEQDLSCGLVWVRSLEEKERAADAVADFSLR